MRFIFDIEKIKKTNIPALIKALIRFYISPKNYDIVAKQRYNICKTCENMSYDKEDCAIKTERSTPCCKICGCSLHLKIYHDDGCPEKKW